MSKSPQSPTNWTLCTVEQIATLLRGVSYTKNDARKSAATGLLPILRANNINGSVNFDDLVYVPSELIKAQQILRKGDVVFAMSSGSKNLVGKSARIIDSIDCGFGAFCGVLRATPKISNKFFHQLFQTREFRHRISEISKGSNINNLKREHLLEYPFPLPPLNEQKRIVAKIEELFSELDAGVASLKQARTQLGTYRQSLLKQAFEGKLTAQWRRDHPEQLESPEQLLTRIQQERDTRYQQSLQTWQTAIEDWEASGKEGKKPTKPTKIKSLDLFDELELAKNTNAPTDWIIVPYGDLCSLVRNGISQKPVGDSGSKIARISAVRPMFFDYDDYRFLSCSEDVVRGYSLTEGDLVFTRYNGARRYVGVCALFTGREPRLYPDKLIRTRPDLPSLSPTYLEIALNSGLSRAWLETKIRTTAGQSGVSGSDIKGMPVPLCSLPEQQEIVRLLEEQFTAIEQNEREIEASLRRAEALRQSILKRAFSGQLVPQDPTDEPAAQLLARIQQERSERQAKAPKKRAKKKSASRKKTRGA